MAVVTPIRLGDNTVYGYEAEGRLVLIDTGPDFGGARGRIDMALRRRLPSLVVATHGHLDHAGLGASWLASGVHVALAEADWPLATGTTIARDRDWEAFEHFVEECGAPPEVSAEVLGGLEERRRWSHETAVAKDYRPAGRGGRWPTSLRYQRFQPVALETVTLPGALRIIEAPGHTPGNVVVVDTEEGWLFSGDQLLPRITPTPAIQWQTDEAGDIQRFRSLPGFVAALRSIRAMGLARCYPGHGEPFDRPNDAIDEILETIETRSEKVLDSLRGGGAQRLFAIAERIYPNAARRRFWQVVATVQGQLDLMHDEGRVALVDGSYQMAGG